MAITATDVVTEFGAYYLGNENGQNAANILHTLTEKSETTELFPLAITDQTVERRAQAGIDRILQPFQKAFTAIGTTTFTPREIPLFRLKIDLQETPDDLANNWLAFLTDNKLARAEWPFVRYWLEKVIMPAHKRDLEMNEIFIGEYAAPTPNTPGAASTAMDGVKNIINDWATEGSHVPFTLGAVPTDPEDFCDYVEAFVKSIPELYWGEGLDIAMSKVLHMRYREGKRIKYNQNYAQAAMLDTVMDYETIKVKGVSSHSGSTKIWTAPIWNKQRFVKGAANMDNMRVENVDRQVKFYTDYWLGIGFWIPELIFSNNVEMGDES